MEGIPEYLDYSEIMKTFLNIDGVVRVHNLRIWVSCWKRKCIYCLHFTFSLLHFKALSVNKVALAAHLAVCKYARSLKTTCSKMHALGCVALWEITIERKSQIISLVWLWIRMLVKLGCEITPLSHARSLTEHCFDIFILTSSCHVLSLLLYPLACRF
jgi:hypothetical protein